MGDVLLVANVGYTSASVFLSLVVRWAFEFEFRYLIWDSGDFLSHVVSLWILRISTAPCLVLAVWAFELRCRTVVLVLAASLCLCRDASRRIANHDGGSQLALVLSLHKELLDTWT